MEWLTIIILVVVAATIWGAVEYGKMQERKKNAEKTSEDMAEDAEAAAKPYVSNPVSDIRRLRRKD
uniref:Uncharacterized protein n=1 Tax=viral metagenome TaxID=1070528 RepID=A0A6H1ZJT1_9ZZZZ